MWDALRMTPVPGRRRPIAALAATVLLGVSLVLAAAGGGAAEPARIVAAAPVAVSVPDTAGPAAAGSGASGAVDVRQLPGTPAGTGSPLVVPGAIPADAAPLPTLPGGRSRVFAGGRRLVAYYGSALSGALGVLGEEPPERIWPRLRRAAAGFADARHPVQPVFELIVTVAHATPSANGKYNGDISVPEVRRYLRAAHRHGVLVVLDLQPGRANFLTVAKRWRWALLDPWVGLALDPEWRMGPGDVPGRRIGSVGAAEVNRVSAWLDRLTARHRLPQKIFMLHQFRTDMIRNIDRIRTRPHLASVQHVDGFGTPGQKLSTFGAVIRPHRFTLGFKLFYDEDTPTMTPRQVLRIRPRVRFVSYQ